MPFTNPVNLLKKPAAMALDKFAPRVPGLPRLTSALLRNAAPADIAAFDKLGPEGMVLDASPSAVGFPARQLKLRPARIRPPCGYLIMKKTHS